MTLVTLSVKLVHGPGPASVAARTGAAAVAVGVPKIFTK